MTRTDFTKPGTYDAFPVKLMRTDSGSQVRAKVNQTTVEEYAAAMKRGDEFPPVALFYSPPERMWRVAAGHHRTHAAERAGLATHPATVHLGGAREARLFALKSNAKHGLRLTTEEKQANVCELLCDAEWGQWSDGLIAAYVGCTEPTVAKQRAALEARGEIAHVSRRLGADGRWYEVDKGAKASGGDPQNLGVASPSTPARMDDAPRILGEESASANRAPTDAEGNPIPEHLMQVKEALDAIAHLGGRVRAVIDWWNRARTDLLTTNDRRHLPQDALKRVDDRFTQEVPDMAATVENLRLHVVCQDCGGHGCGRCPDRRGWFKRAEWEAQP